MKTHVLKGSKKEIAESLARIAGEVREAIVFEEDPVPAASDTLEVEDIFAEMSPYMIEVPDLDDSREIIYSQMQGE